MELSEKGRRYRKVMDTVTQCKQKIGSTLISERSVIGDEAWALYEKAFNALSELDDHLKNYTA